MTPNTSAQSDAQTRAAGFSRWASGNVLEGSKHRTYRNEGGSVLVNFIRTFSPLTLIVTMLLVLSSASYVFAGESIYNCKNGVVHVGDTTFTVREKCGEPVSTEQVSGGGADIVEENWYYGGGTKFPYRFHVRAGKLIEIERLSR